MNVLYTNWFNKMTVEQNGWCYADDIPYAFSSIKIIEMPLKSVLLVELSAPVNTLVQKKSDFLKSQKMVFTFSV